MTRPLIISDCDEVLLHMVAPFKDWLLPAALTTLVVDRYADDEQPGHNLGPRAMRIVTSGGRGRGTASPEPRRPWPQDPVQPGSGSG